MIASTVVVDLERLGGPARMGVPFRQPGGRGDVLSFEYDSSWLERLDAFVFDPDLSLVRGRI